MSSPTTLRTVAVLVLLVVALVGASRVAAQALPPRESTPNDTLLSPEVLTDHRVTLRIWAPKASEVTLRGDWLSEPGPVKLDKDAQGVWAVTVGPLTPDFYSYTFTVDGARTLDPKNAAAAFEDVRPVPHGEIRAAWYRSLTLDTQRRLHLYTPPGYDGATAGYPVLYLLHGGGDDDSGWSTIGRAGFILDNLLAEGKAIPMIVVMPNGSLPRPANQPPPTPGVPPDPVVMAAAQERFTSELLKDVIPFVEKTYRVQAGRESQAIAGLSMGGGQTTRVVTSSPDRFAYVAVWSAGVNSQTTADFERRAAAFLDDAARTNRQLKLLSLSVGSEDFALPGMKNLAQILTRRGIKYELQTSGGGHTWINWRHYLRDLLPQLFRAGAGPS